MLRIFKPRERQPQEESQKERISHPGTFLLDKKKLRELLTHRKGSLFRFIRVGDNFYVSEKRDHAKIIVDSGFSKNIQSIDDGGAFIISPGTMNTIYFLEASGNLTRMGGKSRAAQFESRDETVGAFRKKVQSLGNSFRDISVTVSA